MNYFMTPKQIADYLNVGYRKILDLIAVGDIEAYKIGGQLRVKQPDFEKFLKASKVKNLA